MKNLQLLRRKAVTELVGLSVSSIYKQIREGRFPKPLKIGDGAVAWRADDIKDWMENLKEVER